MSNCKVCGDPLSEWRVAAGNRGCGPCEQLHLMAQIAEGARTGAMPAWWIDPDAWEEWDAHRQASKAVREGLKAGPYLGDTGGLW